MDLPQPRGLEGAERKRRPRGLKRGGPQVLVFPFRTPKKGPQGLDSFLGVSLQCINLSAGGAVSEVLQNRWLAQAKLASTDTMSSKAWSVSLAMRLWLALRDKMAASTVWGLQLEIRAALERPPDGRVCHQKGKQQEKEPTKQAPNSPEIKLKKKAWFVFLGFPVISFRVDFQLFPQKSRAT